MRPLVQIDLIDKLGDLYVWGLADGWWALVSWSLHGTINGHRGQMECSAWVPSRNVWPCGDPDPAARRRTYQHVQRILLPANPTQWPTLAGWGEVTWHHWGRLTADPGPPPDSGGHTFQRDHVK